MSATTDQILEQLKSLSLLEASELVKQIEEAFGVSAAASAGDKEVVLIYVSLSDDGVDSRHQVLVIVVGIVVVDEVAELFPVAVTSSRVGVEHNITGSGIGLDLS